MLSRFLFSSLLCCCLALTGALARAEITIEIVGSGAQQFPLAVTPFAGEEKLLQPITPVIRADLQRSGIVQLIDSAGVSPIPTEPEQVDAPLWQGKGADLLLIGGVTSLPGNQINVRFRLMDLAQNRQVFGIDKRASVGDSRRIGHAIADMVYEHLTGDKGVFSTRIAYVAKQGRQFELQVADADGSNPATVLSSSEPIISPAWSPDGGKLAYVSFEQKKPVVYSHTLATGQRQIIAAFRGSNSAPAWSPDGKRLAVVLTIDGNSQIYLINSDGSGLSKLSNSNAIDTEPNFSPDGRSIVFTSDRGGSPQLYQMPVSGGEAERLSFEGHYSVSPRYSPDGQTLTFIRRDDGKFRVAKMNLANRQVQILTDTDLDESPSFAPNGRMILYATEVKGRGVLAAVSSDGRIKQRLTSQGGDVREPTWAPHLKP